MSKDQSPAAELFEHRDDEDEWEEEPAEVVVRPRRSEVVSFRLPPEDMDALELAAQGAGESLSEFVRKAVTSRITGSSDEAPTVDVKAGRASLLLALHGDVRWSRTDAEHSVSVPDFPPTGVNTTT